MNKRPLWAVIPSGNREKELCALIAQLQADDVFVVIVDTGYENLQLETTMVPGLRHLRDHKQPKNISRWWNKGLSWIARWHNRYSVGDYTVAVLNDDLIIPEGFVQRLDTAIEVTGAAIAYPDQHRYFLGAKGYINHTKPGPISLYERICGYAFAIRGSAGLFADENLAWWYGDDDLDWRARQSGGSCLVEGLQVEHLYPNGSTVGELAEQAGKDRQTFADKWGMTPW